MSNSRGRKLAILVGLVTLVVILVGAFLVREDIRFYWHFQPLGPDEEGHPQYRHRSLDILLVRRPNTFSIRFSGKVTAGENYSRKISTRRAFRLQASRDSSGWAVWVGCPEYERNDFSLPVTPPYRGVTSRYIQAWHFRNADNSGPNGPGEMNVNAPGKKRDFFFVLDEQDYTVARACLDKMLWPKSTEERQHAMARQESLTVGTGLLEITSLTMSGLGVGLTPRIDGMSFQVDLRIPIPRLESMFF